MAGKRQRGASAFAIAVAVGCAMRLLVQLYSPGGFGGDDHDGVMRSTAVSDESAEIPLTLPESSPALNLVHRYSAAWHSVSVVVQRHGYGGDSSAGNHGHVSEVEAGAAASAINAALRAQPLSLNAYGVCPGDQALDEGAPAVSLCRDGWYAHQGPALNTASGSCKPSLAPSGGWPKGASAATRRKAAQQHTRMWVTCDVPQRGMNASWGRSAVPSMANPHDTHESRPADVSVLVVDGSSDGESAVAPLLSLMIVQLQLTLHSLVLYGRVCDTRFVRKAIDAVIASEQSWYIGPQSCGAGNGSSNGGSGGDMMGAIVLSREHDLSPHNAIRPPAYFARFRSNFAAPIHIRGDELFIVTQSPNNASDSGLGYWDPQFGTKWPLLAYSVPRRCLSRLATSPLERIWMVDGQLRSAPHAGFTADMLQAVPPFRNASVEMLPNFEGVMYMGDYCGVSVQTLVFALTNDMFMTYSFMIARTVMLHDAGIPTFLHSASTLCGVHSPHLDGPAPTLPVLFYYPYKREPVQPCQVPRYIAHQVEYTLHTAPSDIEYLKRAVVVLEYSETQMELWRSFNVTNVFLHPMCYHPSFEYRLGDPMALAAAAPVPKRRCDRYNVHFAGAMTESRKSLFRGMMAQQRVFNITINNPGPRVYGVDDVLKAKRHAVSLNVHAVYAGSRREEAILEMVRISLYLSNGIIMASERANDRALEDSLRGAVFFADRGEALNGTFVADALKSVGPLKRRVQQQEYSRTVMRKHFRCEKMAPIVDSFVAVVERTYPHWFVAELFDATLGQGTGK